MTTVDAFFDVQCNDEEIQANATILNYVIEGNSCGSSEEYYYSPCDYSPNVKTENYTIVTIGTFGEIIGQYGTDGDFEDCMLFIPFFFNHDI